MIVALREAISWQLDIYFLIMYSLFDQDPCEEVQQNCAAHNSKVMVVWGEFKHLLRRCNIGVYPDDELPQGQWA
jgi:hypothetical protein